MDRKADFGRVQERLRRAAGRLGSQVETVGEVDGYPIYRLVFGHGRPIVISAGIHGEEPGSVEGGLLFLETGAPELVDTFAFEMYPCLNPYGYERHLRLNQRGVDPNRQFRNPEDPLNGVLQASLDGKSFELALDLHEDEDFYGFYIFETTDGGSHFGPKVREAMAEIGPVAAQAREPELTDGLVNRHLPRGRSIREMWETRTLWPVAVLLFNHSDHEMTIETPGHQPLELRARMHVAGIRRALDLVLGRE